MKAQVGNKGTAILVASGGSLQRGSLCVQLEVSAHTRDVAYLVLHS
jgi:hypothetical protein